MKLTRMFKKEEPKEFNWKLSKRSVSRLEHVDARLVAVTARALRLSPIDFGVTCGLRTIQEQEALVNAKKSQTMKSRHLDGMAVDIVCYVDGKVSWDFHHYKIVAQAFAEASRELDVDIRWGGAWTSLLNTTDAAVAHDNYVALRKRQGRKPFIDGPHFEIPK